MKTKYAIAATLLLSISAFAQKDELKALKKLDSKTTPPTAAEIQEYKSLLDKAEPLMANATDEQKADFYYYKGSYAAMDIMRNPTNMTAGLAAATESFNKAIEIEKNGKKKTRTKEIQEEIYPEIKNAVLTAAAAMGKQNKFKEAAPLYETAYRLSPKDTLYLYNAAAYAVNGKDYDTSLKYFKELEALKFTGSGINYTGKNAKGETEYYGDKKIRDLLVSQKSLTAPGIFREPSKRSEITKNIALIYIQKGEKENAMKALADAKKANPDDLSLLQAESEIYLEAKDYDAYKKTVTEILNKGSKDPNLYFNLGVTSAKSNQVAEAEQYYKKAIELKPDFTSAYFNLGVLQLSGEDKIVEEMNKLGSSAKDVKRYDELKKQRDDKFRRAMKHFEKAHQIDPENQDAIAALSNIYLGLEMDKEYKAMKAKKKA